METILAAAIPSFVGAVATIAAALIARSNGRVAKDREKKIQELEKTTVATSKQYEGEMLNRFGFKVESVHDLRTVIDLNGTVELLRSYEGVKVINEGVTLTYLPGRVWVSPGEIAHAPSLVPPTKFPKHVLLNIQNASKDRCEFRVEVAGGLTRGDAPLAYGVATTFSRGVVITREEMEEAYGHDGFKDEFICFDVDFPIDYLELGVEFPHQYQVDCFPAVFLAYSECMQQVELERVVDCLERTPTGGGCFRIRNPLLGFRYAIYWIPPAKEEVDKLRSRADNSEAMQKTGGG